MVTQRIFLFSKILLVVSAVSVQSVACSLKFLEAEGVPPYSSLPLTQKSAESAFYERKGRESLVEDFLSKLEQCLKKHKEEVARLSEAGLPPVGAQCILRKRDGTRKSAQKTREEDLKKYEAEYLKKYEHPIRVITSEAQLPVGVWRILRKQDSIREGVQTTKEED